MSSRPPTPFWPILRKLCRQASPTLPNTLIERELSQWPMTWQQQHKTLTGIADPSPLSFCYLPLQSAQLASMTHTEFGPSLLGLVHVSQRLCRLSNNTELWSAPLHIATSWQATARASGRGSFLDCHQLLYHSASGTLLLEGHSRYLTKQRWPEAADSPNAPLRQVDPNEVFRSLAEFTVTQTQGRQYAKLSGDWNPIHLGRWPAKLFGLTDALVHGAYMLSLLERAAASPLRQLDVQFLKPVRYQQPLQLGITTSGQWQLRQSEVICLSAQFDTTPDISGAL